MGHLLLLLGLVLSCIVSLYWGSSVLSYAFEEGGHGNVLLNFLWQAKIGESQTPFPGE